MLREGATDSDVVRHAEGRWALEPCAAPMTDYALRDMTGSSPVAPTKLEDSPARSTRNPRVATMGDPGVLFCAPL